MANPNSHTAHRARAIPDADQPTAHPGVATSDTHAHLSNTLADTCSPDAEVWNLHAHTPHPDAEVLDVCSGIRDPVIANRDGNFLVRSTSFCIRHPNADVWNLAIEVKTLDLDTSHPAAGAKYLGLHLRHLGPEVNNLEIALADHKIPLRNGKKGGTDPKKPRRNPSPTPPFSPLETPRL